MSSIREVARIAGVSVATVSRALSKPEKVSPENLRKVQEAADLIDYRPNLLARNFRSKQSYAIVVLVPNIANPFFSRVIRGIEEVAQQVGYAVLLGDTRHSRVRENEYMKLVESRQADGVIQLSPHIPESLRSNNSDDKPDIPFVNACECMDDATFPTIQIDNSAAAITLTQHLLDFGHRRIGVVLGPKNSPLTRDRLLGYRQCIEEAGIAFDEELMAEGDFTIGSGLLAAPHFLSLKRRPTAIFCMNDEMAIGTIQGLKSHGIHVPKDISVAGFDDIEYARYSDPPLTTIAQPTEEIGRTAMSALYNLLEGRDQKHMKHVLPTEFFMRQSVAVARDN